MIGESHTSESRAWRLAGARFMWSNRRIMGARSGSFLFVIGLLLVEGLMAQHGRYLNESANPAIGNPKAIAAGAVLWATSCAGCHGPDGGGGRGPNLVNRTLWHPLSDEAMHQTILEGVPGTAKTFSYYAGLADDFPFVERHAPSRGGASVGLLVREPVGV